MWMKMNYNMKKISIILSVLGMIAFASCKSLDVAPPNSITDEQVQNILNGTDEAKIDMVITAIGNNLQNNFNIAGQTWSGYSSYPLNSQVDQDFLMCMRGNDVIPGTLETASGHHINAYQLIKSQFNTDNTYPYWAMGALLTTNANKVLLYMPKDAASAKVANFRAQALCVRAYAYMQLMERFQPSYTRNGKSGNGMPIYTKYDVNPVAPISSAEETYKFILDDLKEAVDILGTTGYTDQPNDIDLGVAQFLLTRAALWAGEWETAITIGNALLSHYNTFIAEANYGADNADLDAIVAGTKEIKAEDNAFQTLAHNPEAIMGFVQGEGSNTYMNGFANVFKAGEGGYGGNAPRIDDRLYKLMDDKDFRKARFTTKEVDYEYVIDETTKKTARIPEHANLKWAATIAKSYSTRDHHVDCDNYIFRSSEALLMVAEAQAQSGKDADAKATLNKLLAARTKAGETPLTCDNYSGMAGMNALQMVQLQTRIELWCEGGREYYNNKRWNIAVDRSNSADHYYKADANKLSVDEMILAVPLQETSTNTNWASVK